MAANADMLSTKTIGFIFLNAVVLAVLYNLLYFASLLDEKGMHIISYMYVVPVFLLFYEMRRYCIRTPNESHSFGKQFTMSTLTAISTVIAAVAIAFVAYPIINKHRAANYDAIRSLTSFSIRMFIPLFLGGTVSAWILKD